MTKKHTPGPWTVTADGLNVKTLNDVMICEDGGEISASQSQANAILIACAPKLLGLLKEAWGALGYYRADNVGLRADIRKAIDEAEGN